MKTGLFSVLFILSRAALSADLFGGAGAYLSQGAGARPLGMGGAYVSVADDVTALYWNPACLTRMNQYSTEAAAMVSCPGQDKGYNFLALARHVESVGDFGAGLAHSAVTGIERTSWEGERLGDFDSQSFCGTLAYAAPVTYQFRLGLAVKALGQMLAQARSFGCGLDLGAYVMPSLGSYFGLGAVLQNAFSGVAWNSGRVDRLAPNLKIGASTRFFEWHWLIQADLDVPLDTPGQMRPHLGTEFWFDNSWALRAGWNNDAPTAGATWQMDFYEFDYAFSYDPSGLGDEHQVSLLLKF